MAVVVQGVLFEGFLADEIVALRAIVSEIASADPYDWNQHDGDDGCHFCDGDYEYGWPHRGNFVHRTSCVWLRALNAREAWLQG